MQDPFTALQRLVCVNRVQQPSEASSEFCLPHNLSIIKDKVNIGERGLITVREVLASTPHRKELCREVQSPEHNSQWLVLLVFWCREFKNTIFIQYLGQSYKVMICLPKFLVEHPLRGTQHRQLSVCPKASALDVDTCSLTETQCPYALFVPSCIQWDTRGRRNTGQQPG